MGRFHSGRVEGPWDNVTVVAAGAGPRCGGAVGQRPVPEWSCAVIVCLRTVGSASQRRQRLEWIAEGLAALAAVPDAYSDSDPTTPEEERP